MTPLDTALDYIGRGWAPIPVPFRTKKPIGDAWQNLRITAESVPTYFNGGPQNIGVLLGKPSGGLTDVDLDCEEAVALAPYLLPRTAAIFGRASNRASHWLYVTSLATEVEKATILWNDPARKDDRLMVELRIGGASAQTVFPGSTHESGEPITWEEPGEPAAADAGDLQHRVARIAAGCLMARYWPGQGARHQAALTVGGFLARCGLSTAEIKPLVEGVVKAAGDPEWRDRVRAAEDAARAFENGKNACGITAMRELFDGYRVADTMADWLGYQGGTEQPNEQAQKREAGSGRNSEPITEQLAAAEFVARHRDALLYDHDAGAWFSWSGSHWAQERTRMAFDWARQVAHDISEIEPPGEQKKIRRTAFAFGIETFARADRAFAVTSEHWDQDRFLLGTPAGTVDLRTGRMRAAAPGDRITKITGAPPAELADCPRWDAFLSQSTGGDIELIRWLQQWAGYGLTGDTREHALAFVHGGGGNGKSVFLNTITGAMGEYATTAAMNTFTASHSDKHPTDLAMLRGARLVTASETEEGRAWAEARIKQMTGGDPITARFMKQDFFTYVPQFKLTIIGNHKPVLHNIDDAARRRFNIVPFTRKPEKPDRELEQKLKAEWPGILRWMIDGCLDWQANGLIRPDIIVSATETYFSDQDIVAQWLEDKCDVEPGNEFKTATRAELFASWKEYALKAGDEPGNSKSFSDRLQRRGMTPSRGTGGVRLYRGVRMLMAAGHGDASDAW